MNIKSALKQWHSTNGFKTHRNASSVKPIYALAEAYAADHPEGVPDWYSRTEIFEWLCRMNYSKEIANELAELIATNYQLAFNKGYEIGMRKAVVRSRIEELKGKL